MRRFRSWRCVLAASGLLIACPSAAQDAQPSRAPIVSDIAIHVRAAALRFDIPESWIWSVMRVESAGRVDATSHAGAMGLMQVMPGTWASLTARHNLGGNAYDPRANIMAGAAYLRAMHDRYGSPGFLAAYNAGPGRYEQYLRGARGLPIETRNYVARLAPMIGSDATDPSTVSRTATAEPMPPPRPSWASSALFAARTAAAEDTELAAEATTEPRPRAFTPSPQNGLFAPVSGRSPR